MRGDKHPCASRSEDQIPLQQLHLCGASQASWVAKIWDGLGGMDEATNRLLCAAAGEGRDPASSRPTAVVEGGHPNQGPSSPSIPISNQLSAMILGR